jgi:hypothetical protein
MTAGLGEGRTCGWLPQPKARGKVPVWLHYCNCKIQSISA